MTASIIKRAISTVSFSLGVTKVLVKFQTFLKRGSKNVFRILNYHRVNDFNDPFTIDSVSVSDFEKQMDYLSKYYNVLSLDEIYDSIKLHNPLPAQCLAITFDDGYEDNYRFAYPILRKYKLPATIFLTAGCVDSRHSLWFDQVLTGFKLFNQEEYFCPIVRTNYSVASKNKKIAAAHNTLIELKKLPNQRKIKLIKDLLVQLDITSTDIPCNLLTWNMIKEMHCHGIKFGSHTMTHPILTQISSFELKRELAESKKLIEKELDSEVRFFAYPNGKSRDFNQIIAGEVKKAGYKSALTTIGGKNNSITDLYRMRRYRPWQNNEADFAAALLLDFIR